MRKFFEKVFELNKSLKVLIQLCFDGILIIFSFILSWNLRLGNKVFFIHENVWIYISILLPATLLVLYKLSFYKNIVRFLSVSFVKTAFWGSVLSAGLIYFISYIFDLYLPRSIPLIYQLIFLVSICGIRFQLSFFYHYYENKRRKKIAIINTSDQSIKLSNLLHQQTENEVIAFFDDKRTIVGRKINDIPVYELKKLEKIVNSQNVSILLFTSNNISKHLNKTILNLIEKYNIEVKKTPELDGFSNFYDGKLFKSISIEDILGRKIIKADPKLLDKNIKNKTILITGAGGSIGSELCKNILKREPNTIILFDQSEFNLYQINDKIIKLKDKLNLASKVVPILGSIQDEKKINILFDKFNIDTIYHSAAYKHVPLIEMNVIEGIRNNIYGTKLLINKSIEKKIGRFILISSDKAVRPTNFMGATKRIAELLCLINSEKNFSTTFCIVRFGNVLGSSGSVVPLFEKQIKKGGPVTVTHPKVERYFMTIREATELVIQAGSMTKKKGEIFILNMGKSIKILNLAKQMIRLNGFVPKIVDNNKMVDANPNEIKIHFTGLRPGEKIKEELVYNTKIFRTQHPRIMKTLDKTIDNLQIQEQLFELDKNCDNYDLNKIIEILKKFDHNFNFQNSNNDILSQK